MAAQLAPAPCPIAIFPSFVARRTETIIMRERLSTLSNGAFRVTTIDGTPLLQITADTFSISARKRVLDMAGNHLFTLRSQYFSIPHSFYAESPAGEKLFEIKGKLKLVGSKAVGHLTNATNGQRTNLLMDAGWFGKHSTITNEADGQILADINREFHGSQLLTNRHTYAVTIAPGVDIALIVAMVVAEDERRAAKQ